MKDPTEDMAENFSLLLFLSKSSLRYRGSSSTSSRAIADLEDNNHWTAAYGHICFCGESFESGTLFTGVIRLVPIWFGPNSDTSETWMAATAVFTCAHLYIYSWLVPDRESSGICMTSFPAETVMFNWKDMFTSRWIQRWVKPENMCLLVVCQIESLCVELFWPLMKPLWYKFTVASQISTSLFYFHFYLESKKLNDSPESRSGQTMIWWGGWGGSLCVWNGGRQTNRTCTSAGWLSVFYRCSFHISLRTI